MLLGVGSKELVVHTSVPFVTQSSNIAGSLWLQFCIPLLLLLQFWQYWVSQSCEQHRGVHGFLQGTTQQAM